MYDSAGSTPQSSMSAAQQDYAYENIHWEKTQSWDIGCLLYTSTAGNAIDNRNFTAAECRLREDVFKIARIFKENFEEFKNSYVTTVAVPVSYTHLQTV